MDIGADSYSFAWPLNGYIHNGLSNMPDSGAWSFSMGLGASAFSYGKDLFNPFNLIISLFPNDMTFVGYLVATILQIFLVSILSHLYLKKLGLSSFASMVGGLVITFAGYFICWGQLNVFGAMYVLFFFILYAFERWLVDQKWLMLLLSVALMFAAEFYFLYMVILFMAFYIIFRYIWIHDFHAKDFFQWLLKTVIIVVGGLLLACVLVLPQVYSIQASLRINAAWLPSLALHTPTEYISLLLRLFSNTLLGINDFIGYKNFYESPFLYYSLLLVFLIPVFFKKPMRSKKIVMAFILVFAAILLPNITNPVFNMFSANAFRWLFIFAPVAGIATGFGLDYICSDKTAVKKSAFSLVYFSIIGIMTLYFIFLFPSFKESRRIPFVSAATVIVVCTLYFIILLNRSHLIQKTWKGTSAFRILMVCVLIAELCVNACLVVIPRSTIPTQDLPTMPYFDSTQGAVEELRENDGSFFRVNKSYSAIDLNDAMIQSYYGEKLYNTCLSAELKDIMTTFELRKNSAASPYLFGLEDRQLLRNLIASKYMLTTTPVSKYGYQHIGNYGNLYIYENTNVVPLLYAYDAQLSNELFEQLDVYGKQEALYFGFVSDETLDLPTVSTLNSSGANKYSDLSIDKSTIISDVPDFPVSIDDSGNFSLDCQAGVQAQVSFNLAEPAHTPVVISFDFDSPTAGTSTLFYAGDGQEFNDGNSIAFDVAEGENHIQLYIDCVDLRRLSLKFPLAAGSYTVSNLNISATLFDVAQRAEALSADAASVDFFSDNYIKASYTTASPKMLFFQTPFDSGWQVKINGQPGKVYNINHGFCGIYILPGENTIELSYHPPLLKTGAVISAATLCGIILAAIIIKKRKKAKTLNNNLKK